MHFTAFHPDWKMRDVAADAAGDALARTVDRAQGRRPLRLHRERRRPEGGSTFCHVCAAELIGRDGYELTAWTLENGRCGSCGEPCPGRFEKRPDSGGRAVSRFA